jgi:hypothetical protein
MTDNELTRGQELAQSKKAADLEYRKSITALGAEIQELSRAPFRQILAEMLGCKPDIASLQDFANRQPDRWAQSVAIMAKNAGYEQKQTVEHNHSILLAQMSDAQLFAELRKSEQELETLMHNDPALIEHETAS